MKENDRHSALTEETTNLYPLYPDLDAKIPAGKAVNDRELAQENDQLNPDPDTLDRG